MDRTPTYLQYNVQDDGDASFRAFGIISAANYGSFHENTPSATYADIFPLHAPSVPSGHASAHEPSFTFLPTDLVISHDERTPSTTPYLMPSRFESPGLLSGSSSTPKTHESQQLVTPNNVSVIPHATSDQNAIEDFDDVPSSSLPPQRKRLDQHKTRKDTEPDKQESKRKHFLLRNRVAAMKCRKKKKEWVTDLEETKLGLESQNAHLHMELDGLVDEVSRIRAQLMVHANCNDSNIDKWIENKAKQFVIGTSERYDQILARFGPTKGPNDRHESMSPASEYAATGPTFISPLTTPSHLPTPHTAQIPSPPAFYNPSVPMDTIGCHTLPSHAPSPFTHGLDQTLTASHETDYDGMPAALYDGSVS
ncbi:hypothetical protein F5Y19DRAFT_274359 [Xylariaceae sp. FL1651]|nr:hypothetical protein F5Y19DRAFT_274359 [Xylariaceae sp. FL1651]